MTMFSVAETVSGYRFRPDNATISSGFHYNSVSYTALYPWRKGLTTGQSHSNLCFIPISRNVLLLFKSSWSKLAKMERVKLLSLVGMVLQSSLLALTTRYSRIGQERSRYLSSTAVLAAEVVKALVCLMLLATSTRSKSLLSQLTSAMNYRDIMKSCVPSLLYTLQNNLHFVAVSYLDAATFQVTYQLKILTTALVSVLVLRRRLDAVHWSALFLLIAGVVMVQYPQTNECSLGGVMKLNCDVSPERRSHVLVGVATVLAMSVSSGFAGVYTERILKAASSSQAVWIRNLQLALTSCVFGVFVVYVQDGSAVTSHGFFYQYDHLTWCIVLQLAALGLLISMVMKHADNLVKGFASSIAIVLTTGVSGLLLGDLHVSCSFLLGSVVVLGSVLLYNVDRTGEFSKPESVI